MRRKIALALSLGCSLVIVNTTAAQGPPKPGPEHQKLGYFVGEWEGEGELKANPFMPAGKYTSEDKCEWFQGGFAVICRAKGKGPAGEVSSLGILSYSNEEKAYTYYGLDSNGMVSTTVAKGQVANGRWTYTQEEKYGGQLVKGRYTLSEISPTSYSFRWEVEGPDGKWLTLMEGVSKKD